MFFRELEIPLIDIKKILDNPNYDREQALLTQKTLLEQNRNRLNGIIELISDVMKGVNTMSFESFSKEDIQKIVNHTLECMSKESLDKLKNLIMPIWHILLLKCLQRAIRKCSYLIMQEIFCWIWQKNICKIQNLQKRTTANSEKAALNTSHIVSGIIMGYNMQMAEPFSLTVRYLWNVKSEMQQSLKIEKSNCISYTSALQFSLQ